MAAITATAEIGKLVRRCRVISTSAIRLSNFRSAACGYADHPDLRGIAANRSILLRQFAFELASASINLSAKPFCQAEPGGNRLIADVHRRYSAPKVMSRANRTA
jgi:hypothetical protein